MPHIVNTSISLRNRQGIVFGRLMRVSRSGLQVEISADYRQAELLEFQIDLTVFNTTIYGTAVVVEAKPGAGALSRYQLRLEHMSERDHNLFDEWLADVGGGGTPSQPHLHMPSSTVSSVRRRASHRVRGPITRPSISSTARSGSGRQAVRDTLRARLGPAKAAPKQRKKPKKNPRPAAGADLFLADWRSTLGNRKANPGAGIDCKVAAKARPPVVVVKYRSPRAYVADFERYLSNDALFVRWLGRAPNQDARLSLRIKPPGSPMLSCEGRLVAVLPTGFGVALQLDEDQRRRLAAVAARLG